jgi:hypothetical protein
MLSISPKIDPMLNLAASGGLVVFLDRIDMGRWLVALRNNDATKAFNYGAYIGNRYKDFPALFGAAGTPSRQDK